MESYVINGGNRLYGSVEVQRSKNAVLPMLAASLLTEETVTIEECPQIADVDAMVKLLSAYSLSCTMQGSSISVSGGNAEYTEVSPDLSKALRSSCCLLGASLARFGQVFLPLPGGCAIGARPIDIHLAALSKLGVLVREGEGGVYCRRERFSGGEVTLPYPSVGATENLMLYASLAEGETIVRGCAREPEIVDLQTLLCRMGANIRGAGTDAIAIEGVKRLHGARMLPMPDRIECGTFLLACACCGGEVTLFGGREEKFDLLCRKLRQNGCKVWGENDKITIKSGDLFSPLSVVTGPYPAFATDLQPLLCVLAARCEGESRIRETVFESRFSHLEELRRMGASVRIEGDTAFVAGGTLCGARVRAKDLRGGAALVLAGLCAEGLTQIDDIGYIDRGYANFERKLSLLGARIWRMSCKKNSS